MDQAINRITTFGTHNSYSDNQDSSYSSFSFFNADQYYSIADQLDSGARIIRLDPIGTFVADGVTYNFPHNFQWAPGSSHTLSVPTPQYNNRPATRTRSRAGTI